MSSEVARQVQTEIDKMKVSTDTLILISEKL